MRSGTKALSGSLVSWFADWWMVMRRRNVSMLGGDISGLHEGLTEILNKPSGRFG